MFLRCKPWRHFLLLAVVSSATASAAQSTSKVENQLAVEAARGGYVPVSLLEEGLRSCEDLGDHQLDQCGAILLNAMRTALKFRTYTLPGSNTIVTHTDIFDRSNSDRSSYSDTDDMRSHIFDLEVELDILIEENRLLWHELSKTRDR